jgi:hypothetical protein
LRLTTRRFPVKISFTTALLAVACLLASVLGYAQSPVRANIPFEFTIGQKVLPPGQYSISSVSDRVLEFNNWEKHVTIFVPATATAYVGQKPHELVFRVYGDQYFLHEIRGGLGEFALDIQPSKLEKETQRLAAAHPKQQNAEIALK